MSNIEDESPSWLDDSPAAAPAPVVPPPVAAPRSQTPQATTVAAPLPVAVAVAAQPAPPAATPEEISAQEAEAVKGAIMFMRLANLAVSITIIVMSSLKLIGALAYPQYWVLCFYATCGGLLICCLETQLSFIRTPIALNFGFLFNPTLRFAFYMLLATICYSLVDLFSRLCAGGLVAIALYNTYVLIKYPSYRKLRDEIAAQEDERINAAIREKVRKEATSAMFSSAK